MDLSETLLSRELVTPEDLKAARQRQQVAGGLIGENLLALGAVRREQLQALGDEAPAPPRSLQDAGLAIRFLHDLLLKVFYISGSRTSSQILNTVKLTRQLLEPCLTELEKLKLIEVTAAESALIWRYALTSGGRKRAVAALEQSQYVGPAPVPLDEFYRQVERQSITHEQIEPGALEEKFSHLVLPRKLVGQLGAAINSGRTILLYGSSGNGKSSVARALGQVFRQTVYMPYCVSVDDQIIKIFDPAIHEEVPLPPEAGSAGMTAKADQRWVRCRRPLVHAGGELTLRMLDLDFNPISKFYEAPLQVKAMGGVFVIDDFGRQMVRPEDLLNRWIVPLEKKVDYLTLHTGKKFEVLFDEIVIFSTNMPPRDLLDEALMRRINYKLHVPAPTLEDYAIIFKRMCKLNNLEFSEDFLPCLEQFYARNKLQPAAYHPKSLIDHVVAVCKFEGRRPRLTVALLESALEHLIVRDSD